MLLRYGQVVKLLKPTTLDITSNWHHVISQWKTKYKIVVEKRNHTDWNGRVIGTYDNTTIQIPAGTLGVITFIHVDSSYEQYRISIPNPVKNSLGAGSNSKMLPADYFTLNVTQEELESMRNAQGKCMFQKSRNNLEAMKKLEEMQKFNKDQL